MTQPGARNGVGWSVRTILVILLLLPVVAVRLGAEEPPKGEESQDVTVDDLYEAGKNLFEAYAPPEIKEQYEFPDKARWDDFVARLQAALSGDDPAALAGYEEEARTVLVLLRSLAAGEEYADWLEERMDYIEAAKEMPPKKAVIPPRQQRTVVVPDRDLWLRRVRARAKPATADNYVKSLKPVFAATGVPGDLVWLAEVESTFNPKARSPAGARGLFQLMPETAKGLGLRTFLPDERIDPTKSAQAAAKMLRDLHRRFGNWPLALAAYNAGPGRIQRLLESRKAKTFAEIAPHLPLETRMYVPRVLATVQTRAGVDLLTVANR